MIWVWTGFIALVLLMLALDLGVFHRKARVVTVKDALAWSAVWIAMGLSFAVFVYFAYDGRWFGLGTTADVVDGRVNDGATPAGCTNSASICGRRAFVCSRDTGSVWW